MPLMNTLPPTEEIELAKLRDAYPALAVWMACDSDDETLIFRRFSNLAARNILHMQAELFALEQEILDADALARGTPEGMVASMRWETLNRRSKEATAAEHKRVKDLERLQDLLRAYCTRRYLFLIIQNGSDNGR
jgi:hypothetical protein